MAHICCYLAYKPHHCTFELIPSSFHPLLTFTDWEFKPEIGKNELFQ